MKITDISTLKINTLTQAQYNQALAEGRINENELYLIPDVGSNSEVSSPPISFTTIKNNDQVTITTVLENGESHTDILVLDETGRPKQIFLNEEFSCKVDWYGFD